MRRPPSLKNWGVILAVLGSGWGLHTCVWSCTSLSPLVAPVYHHCPRSESGDLALLASVLIVWMGWGWGNYYLYHPVWRCSSNHAGIGNAWDTLVYIHSFLKRRIWDHISCSYKVYSGSFQVTQVFLLLQLDIQGWCRVDQFTQLWFIAWFSDAASWLFNTHMPTKCGGNIAEAWGIKSIINLLTQQHALSVRTVLF